MKILIILLCFWILIIVVSGFPLQKQTVLAKLNAKKSTNFLKNQYKTNLDNNDVLLKLEIYSEMLCPDCQHFINGSFEKALKVKSFLDYVEIKMYFYGNAEETLDADTQKYQYRCQHGPKECEGNLISNCVVNVISSNAQALNLIVCMEKEIQRYAQPAMIKYDKVLQKCYKSKVVKEKQLQSILRCSNGSEGSSYQHMAAQKTEQQPDIEFVPWILIDGVHSNDQQNAIVEDLIQFTCDYYQQRQIIPPFCKSSLQNL